MKDIAEVELLRSRFRTNQIGRLSGYAIQIYVVEGVLMPRSKIDELEQRIYEGFAESINKLNGLEKQVTSLASPLPQSAPNNATNGSNDTIEVPAKQSEPTTGSLTKNPMKWKPNKEELASPTFRAIHGIGSPLEDALKQLHREAPDVFREVLPEGPINGLQSVLETVEQLYHISQIGRLRNRNIMIIPAWLSTLFSSCGLVMHAWGASVDAGLLETVKGKVKHRYMELHGWLERR